ncbi:MAG: DUF1800 family protein [Bacteroidetes bacterium]|nr:DUF1800 family protein [Bacteroidota bacterium]
MSQIQIQHLLWRMGFGPSVQDWNSWAHLNPKSAWAQLKTEAANPTQAIAVVDDMLDGLKTGLRDRIALDRENLDEDQKKMIRQRSREDLKQLNLVWLDEMVQTKAQLREKMAFFWHGHFASRNLNIYYQQQLLDVIRQNALGNFGDLLRAVSKSAAMLAFLNNQQNKKQHPNENFAREVMELFTLGRGHYTEKDVQEAARAFTGWGFRPNGEFVLRKFQHDADEKTVLGKTGNLDGDAVLDVLLEQKQTARFITRKLYRFLVHDEQAPEDRIEALATKFYNSQYDIMALLDAIANSDWFYAADCIGAKIKSPIELWVGMRRMMPFTLDNPAAQLMVQKVLGQILFLPPNVAGWPGGKNWIDSSSLMIRLRLPQLLTLGGQLAQGKTDDDVQGGKADAGAARKLSAQVHWDAVYPRFQTFSDADLMQGICKCLWQCPNATTPEAVLQRHTRRESRNAQIESLMVQLMATPEYQLC